MKSITETLYSYDLLGLDILSDTWACIWILSENSNRSSKIPERLLNLERMDIQPKRVISEPEQIISKPEWISEDNQTQVYVALYL